MLLSKCWYGVLVPSILALTIHRIGPAGCPVQPSQGVQGNQRLWEVTCPGQGLAKVVQLVPESELDSGASDLPSGLFCSVILHFYLPAGNTKIGHSLWSRAFAQLEDLFYGKISESLLLILLPRVCPLLLRGLLSSLAWSCLSMTSPRSIWFSQAWWKTLSTPTCCMFMDFLKISILSMQEFRVEIYKFIDTVKKVYSKSIINSHIWRITIWKWTRTKVKVLIHLLR